MESINLNPVTVATRYNTADTTETKRQRSFPWQSGIVAIGLFACLIYGISQLDSVTGYFQEVFQEVGKIEQVLEQPKQYLQ